ncbi:MAG: MerR family transcriptional regulator [Streptosporangiaceae bacterium]
MNENDAESPPEWTVDELAGRAGLPVRTIREYQTMGLLPPPRKRGRVGVYSPAHLARLQLIGRLQDRGYSLKGISDLLRAWTDGADLGGVLGLAPDQLVHIDEPGVAADLSQLASTMPGLVPDRLDDLLAAGVLEARGPGRYCIPSPSLLQLAADALAAGIEPETVTGLLTVIGTAASAIAGSVTAALAALPPDADPDRVAALTARGRGLLGHGTGRLTIYTLGRRLGVSDGDPAPAMLTRPAGTRR